MNQLTACMQFFAMGCFVKGAQECFAFVKPLKANRTACPLFWGSHNLLAAVSVSK